MSRRTHWIRRPEGSPSGDYSPDDQLGRIDLPTSEKFRPGAAEVREGLTFCPSLALALPGAVGSPATPVATV